MPQRFNTAVLISAVASLCPERELNGLISLFLAGRDDLRYAQVLADSGWRHLVAQPLLNNARYFARFMTLQRTPNFYDLFYINSGLSRPSRVFTNTAPLLNEFAGRVPRQ